jgi:integrase/recombinase XerD
MKHPLQPALDDYLALRRSLGFKLHKEGRQLPQFLVFLQKNRAAYITARLALDWIMQSAGRGRTQRLRMVRGFARYITAFDSRTEVPPSDLVPARCIRPRPYIYSDNEIQRLIEEARKYPRDKPRGTYYCLLGLLAVSGLRIGEAIRLRMEDVDLVNAVLTIRNTKFGKSRLVPLHPTTVNELGSYKQRRDALLASQSSAYFFISRKGTPLIHSSIYRVFNGLSVKVGIRKARRGGGPRLHDLRHRFAVSTLIDWYRAGVDVEHQLPTLATFLGHVSVECTYWYLNEYPELMQLAASKLNNRWEGKA